ncbi:MAG: glutathione S-transferase N-terminal domain-containing protein, partial [Vitreoscilla sp.]
MPAASAPACWPGAPCAWRPAGQAEVRAGSCLPGGMKPRSARLHFRPPSMAARSKRAPRHIPSGTTMITLSGFTLSNYYNKVKMVLIEKGIPFVEEHCAKASEETLMCSPLGKVPFIR